LLSGYFRPTRSRRPGRIRPAAAQAALLIDYVVTVAGQAAAGTVAVVSAVRSLGPYSLEITIAVVVLMCFVNLRGLKEAGRPVAMPTYFFVAMLTVMMVTGVVRHLFWGLPQYDAAHLVRGVPVEHGDGLAMGATILVLLRAFANGGASLTGVEAISNTVSSFREPQGVNARRVLTVMACILAFLLSGVSYLAYATHATPYLAGYPSVSPKYRARHSVTGYSATCSTRWSRFRPRQSFHWGEHQFQRLPCAGQLRRGGSFPAPPAGQARSPAGVLQRHHRADRVRGRPADRYRRVGECTGALLCRRGVHRVRDGRLRHDETSSDAQDPGWRHKLAINLSAGITSTVVVGIFAIAKFTEGAWLVVVIFPLLVFGLMRLNREYRAEAAILERFRTNRPDFFGVYSSHHVFVLVNSIDLAVIEAPRYGRGLRADGLTAVHFMVDEDVAERIRKRWKHYGLVTPLKIIDVPDRRLTRAANDLVCATPSSTPAPT
jgi:hypothetical protein